jgi:hypothetical protein
MSHGTFLTALWGRRRTASLHRDASSVSVLSPSWAAQQKDRDGIASESNSRSIDGDRFGAGSAYARDRPEGIRNSRSDVSVCVREVLTGATTARIYSVDRDELIAECR